MKLDIIHRLLSYLIEKLMGLEFWCQEIQLYIRLHYHIVLSFVNKKAENYQPFFNSFCIKTTYLSSGLIVGKAITSLIV